MEIDAHKKDAEYCWYELISSSKLIKHIACPRWSSQPHHIQSWTPTTVEKHPKNIMERVFLKLARAETIEPPTQELYLRSFGATGGKRSLTV